MSDDQRESSPDKEKEPESKNQDVMEELRASLNRQKEENTKRYSSNLPMIQKQAQTPKESVELPRSLLDQHRMAM